MSNIRTITLNDGVEIPVLAFGTGCNLFSYIVLSKTSNQCVEGRSTAQAWTDTSPIVTLALQKGYRHFDCAWHYKNGVYTGKALKESGIPREKIFITCKIGSFDDDPSEFDTRKFVDAVLKDLQVEYIDLLVLHADILVGSITQAWKAMEEIKKEGLARSIGLSNFSTKSLEEILSICEIKPSINQIEFHPYSLSTYLPTLLPLCDKYDIKIAAYGSLMSLVRHRGGPVDEVVEHICHERGMKETGGQVLLRWAQQITEGIVITTTNKPDRMVEQILPFLEVISDNRLSQKHLDEISGAERPFRFWGTNWPYFMQGEGGIQACPEDATHRNKPGINGGRGW
ncbi:hypothetical protein I204_01753 [Kwoniella mangroviensis CBS 8886]|nr:hypothetical protein I204_01753 [Kwoniella mangroviensis CBS 8886]